MINSQIEALLDEDYHDYDIDLTGIKETMTSATFAKFAPKNVRGVIDCCSAPAECWSTETADEIKKGTTKWSKDFPRKHKGTRRTEFTEYPHHKKLAYQSTEEDHFGIQKGYAKDQMDQDHADGKDVEYMNNNPSSEIMKGGKKHFDTAFTKQCYDNMAGAYDYDKTIEENVEYLPRRKRTTK